MFENYQKKNNGIVSFDFFLLLKKFKIDVYYVFGMTIVIIQLFIYRKEKKSFCRNKYENYLKEINGVHYFGLFLLSNLNSIF